VEIWKLPDGAGMRDTDNERVNRGYLWFALALLAVLLGSSGQVALRRYATSNSPAQEPTASLTAHAEK
jgi:hypothetical protein